MKEDEVRDYLREALENPEIELDDEFIGRLDPETHALIKAHQILDHNLSSALQKLASRLDGQMIHRDAFNSRLEEALLAKKGESSFFFLKIRLENLVEYIKEKFLYSNLSIFRWLSVAAIAGFFVVPIVREEMIQHRDSSLESPSMAEGTSPKPLASSGVSDESPSNLAAAGEARIQQLPTRREADGVPAQSAARERQSGAQRPTVPSLAHDQQKLAGESREEEVRGETAGAPPTEPGPPMMERSAAPGITADNPDLEEKLILASVDRAQNAEDKKKALTRLMNFYQSHNRPDRAKETQLRINNLR